jgi:hypothetical protein
MAAALVRRQPVEVVLPVLEQPPAEGLVKAPVAAERAPPAQELLPVEVAPPPPWPAVPARRDHISRNGLYGPQAGRPPLFGNAFRTPDK